MRPMGFNGKRGCGMSVTVALPAGEALKTNLYQPLQLSSPAELQVDSMDRPLLRQRPAAPLSRVACTQVAWLRETRTRVAGRWKL